MNSIKDFSWKIAGPAGFGIMSTGLMFSKVFSRQGYNVVDGNEYPSLVQGGHNTYTVRFSTQKIYSLKRKINVLVALDRMTIDMNLEEVTYGGFVVYDSGAIKDLDHKEKDINFIPAPLEDLTKKADAPKIARNNVTLGISMALLNHDFGNLEEIIEENFKEKGNKVIDFNIRAAEEGYNFIKEKMDKVSIYKMDKGSGKPKLLMTGNDAVFTGGVKAGCKFYAAYPMTPSSSILHSFASVEKDFNIVTKHAESEIAVVNMTIGASFAGVRSMLATSGGGFALMNEGISAAAMTETPLVMVLCQRPAPATGLPTWSEQGDMLFAVSAGHGEFPRIVMSPGDPEECFYMTGVAFNLAERYQIPVIILLDKFLSESHFTIDKLMPEKIKIDRGKLIFSSKNIEKEGKSYLRYLLVDDGVSPRAIIGLENCLHIANTDEHNEYGFSEESPGNRKKMVDKRFAKLKNLENEVKGPNIYGPLKAETTIVSWGSCKMPILEALKYLNSNTDKVNLIHFTYLLPFPLKNFLSKIEKSKKIIIAENNKTSQLSILIKANTGIEIKDKILKYNGRQFLAEDIIEGWERIVKKK